MRRPLLAVLIAAAALLGLAACDEDQPDTSRICVDQQHHRVDGAKCSNTDHPTTATSPYIWWYLAYGRSLPRVGAAVKGGSGVEPKSATIEHDEKAPAGKGYTSSGYHAPVEEPVEPHVAPVEPHVGGFGK